MIVHAPVDAQVFPHHPDSIPPGTVDVGAYRLEFAWTRQDLHAVQRLRYRVFNEEMGEGFAHNNDTRRDEDERDPWFHHLMVVLRTTGECVGTYRLQTAVMAATRFGFYSATLFELGALPGAVLEGAVEIGRACVAREHRTGRVLRLLWRGLARYVAWNGKRYFFGSCSLPGTNESVAAEAWRAVHARQLMHDRFLVKPRPEHRALADDGRMRPLIDAASLDRALPPLFEGYLSMGARVCGAPAFDTEFNTTDFLVLLDAEQMDARTHRSLFG